MKTVKTTQGHLAVIKSRNKAYEVEFFINLLKPSYCFTVFIMVLLVAGKKQMILTSEGMQVATNRLLVNKPILK